MQKAVIVAAGRSPVGKAGKGVICHTRPDDMDAHIIQGVIKQAHSLETNQVEDIMLGCAFPEAEQGMNVARIVFAPLVYRPSPCSQ
jgi:acetyl-CoA acyltransferase